MSDISIGAVGAAAIAGLVTLLSLVIGKEQKVSDFRQAWIEDLRKCFVSYLVSINAISDSIQLGKRDGKAADGSALLASYKQLNEATHGITFRVNANEQPTIALLKAMEEFEALFRDNSNIVPDKIKCAETKFIGAAKDMLKFEWNRVKRGERTYVITRWGAIVSVVILTVILGVLLIFRPESNVPGNTPNPYLHRGISERAY